MKTIFKTYRFKLQPTQQQRILLEKHFGCTRFVYNHFLHERKQQYQQHKKSDSYNKQSAALTKLKSESSHTWLREVNSQALQCALANLDAAYTNFFRGTTKFPSFKSKKHKHSFTVPQGCKLVNDRIVIPKFREGIKTVVHRVVDGTVEKMTLTKTATGSYFVSILTTQRHTPADKTNISCGIDLGIKDLVTTSQGVKFKNERSTVRHEKLLSSAQRRLSRKQKGSNSYERQRRKVAKIHDKIRSVRRDALHKITHQLIKTNDVIVMEDLNVVGMMKNRCLAKHIADSSWGAFTNMLQYKAQWNDRQVIKIHRFYPSSKTCHVCGYINTTLKLSDRMWTCHQCHTTLDRDVNAAKNILAEGLQFMT